MDDDKQRAPSAVRWSVQGFAAYALVGGGVTLAGWFLGRPRLTDWAASGISMFPNTALAAVCSGAALLLATLNLHWAARLSSMLGFIVALLGGATLFEHLSGVNLGIDTILIQPTWGEKAALAPGRMGPPASTSYLLLGLALFLTASGQGRARRIVPALGISVCVAALLALMGYVSGADPLFAVARLTGIAMQTASILLALALGVVANVPEQEPVRTLQAKTAAGLLARRSLPFIVGLPLILGWLRIRGQRAGLFDTAMGTTLLTVALAVIFCGLLGWWVDAVAQYEDKQKQTEEKLRDAQRELLIHAAELEGIVAERTAKLQETVNDLQSFSYSIAHDMRAPLRAMGTFAQLLMDELPTAGTSSDIRAYCQRIIVGAARLDNLINDALNYTKAALQEFPHQTVDLSRLVRGLVDTYPNLHAVSGNIQIEGHLPMVLGNESLLTQCFSNLLGNAVKFVAPGVLPKVRVWSETKEGYARIWIEDNGIGIPQHLQPRLFAMFQKLDNQYEGTGIGLAIVRKVVERMGGKIGLESESDRGSRFWVELRVAPKKQDV